MTDYLPLSLSEAIVSFTAMQDITFADILAKNLHLGSYMEYFRATNQSSNAPYHNEYHAMCMMLNCYEAAVHENLDPASTRGLIGGAMFHDHDHSMGYRTDDINIERAIAGLANAHTHVRKTDLANQLSDEEYFIAVDSIKITKYPYDQSPKMLTQMIIRDADLMQVYEMNDRRLCKQFRGLKEEVERLHGKKYSMEEWANGCKSFNDAVVWHTQWAKNKANVLDHNAQTARLQQLILEYK